jgi:cytochrome c biogenesis protein CcdA/glutaredoxin
MKYTKQILLSLVLALMLFAAPAAQAQAPNPVVIYLFWGDGCPHCASAKVFLSDLMARHPSIELRDYEVWYDQNNQFIFTQMAQAYGFEPGGVPTMFIGERHWVGYADTMRADIEAVVLACEQNGCRDAGAGIIPGIAAQDVPPISAPEAGQPINERISIPIIGEVDLGGHSLIFSTALIAFVDGFNPCSLWALSVLLALTLHTGSRKKVLLVGVVFLTVTSLVYALFILGLFTMFTVVSFVGWIQVLVAAVALFFAAVNIKDYFLYKEGLSFTIDEKQKPGIYQKMRRILDAGDSLRGIVAATIALAAGVSLVEFSCTAGFPVLWTNLLISQQADAWQFGGLLLLYMLIYQLDELAIFLIAVFTLRASRLEEKHGRILKLVGGMLMLTLALVMLINPALMGDVNSSMLIFLLAFGATGLVLLVHRSILPAFGIHLGTEWQKSNLHKKGVHRRRDLPHRGKK